MSRVTVPQNNFASGEIDPRLTGQTDIKAYAQGARRLRNMQRLATGGVERRLGTYDLVPVAALARLVEFEFADDERYVIALSDQTAEIFDLNGVPLQVVTGCPWDEDQVYELTFTQLGDTMVIAHEAFVTRLLKRTAAETFALLSFVFDSDPSGNKIYQPYFKFAAPDVTLTPSAVSGAGVTLTASSATGWGGFVAEHVGCRFRIHDVEVLVTAVTDATHATVTVKGTIKRKLDLDPFKTTAGVALVEVTHAFHGFAGGHNVTFSGANDVGGIAAASINGARAITVTDEHHYVFTAGASATLSEDGGGSNVEVQATSATRNWLEQSISAVRGYPRACAFHEGRLWLGGTVAQPDGNWGSKALLYFNFDVGKGDDGDSPQGAVGSEDISRILHLVSNNELQVFTPLRELVYVTPDGVPITPGNQRVKSQSIAGSGQVQPVVFDGATLFVQENGQSVSELTYSSEQGGYLAVPVSTLAGHLVRNPVSAAASAGAVARAEHYAFFVNDDGSLAVFHSLRSENLAGWALWELGEGRFRSVASIGPYVFFVVEVRGGHRLYRLASDAIVSLDGAVLHTSDDEQEAWILDARVRGREVHLVSERGYHGAVTIPGSGEVHLGVGVHRLVAGDAYFGVVESLPPVVDLGGGSRSRMARRIVRTALQLYEAYEITVDGRQIDLVGAGGEWDGDLTPFTGIKDVGSLGFSREPTVIISQSIPLPFTLLALTMEVKV